MDDFEDLSDELYTIQLNIDTLLLNRAAALELDPSPERDTFIADLDRSIAQQRACGAQLRKRLR